MADTNTLAQRCRDLRASRKWTQKAVAQYTGLTQGQISHIENGRVTSSGPKTIKALAKLYGVTTSFLLGGDQ